MTITLHLSRNIQRKLGALATRKGQNIEIIANDLFQQAVLAAIENSTVSQTVSPANEKALEALRQIAQMQHGTRYTDGSQTDRFIRSGRTGAMDSDDTTE
jgi:hypothetical protein